MKRRLSSRGFTLVELLTVIAIIVLLVGILVPAVNAVRTQAKATASRGTLSALSTGLETFRADQQVGSGAYPPSVSDATGGQGKLKYSVQNPHVPISGGGGGPIGGAPPNISISGAGLLVWALAGADLLGSPGFKVFRTTGTNPSQYWSEDTDNGVGGAYELHPTTRQPLKPRVAPFVDLSKVRVTAQDAELNFPIEAEVKACQAQGVNVPNRHYPMFLDGFGYPILYWRADPAGFQVADRSPNDPEAAGTGRGIYHYRDNSKLLREEGAPPSPDAETYLRTALTPTNSAGTIHPLIWNHRANGGYPANNVHLPPGQSGSTLAQYPFVSYIRNPAVSAKVAPQRAESFLLVSPGEDGLYGTADDITNFDHNGAALSVN